MIDPTEQYDEPLLRNILLKKPPFTQAFLVLRLPVMELECWSMRRQKSNIRCLEAVLVFHDFHNILQLVVLIQSFYGIAMVFELFVGCHYGCLEMVRL
jgi:Fe-S-cluster formation regulator IscX/YfhJ